MSTELSNGVIIPEEYSDDWYDEMSINLRKLNDVITAASDNATDIQRLDTDKANQSDLTALTSRVSQNETNIGNLQTAVSTAQATANSAQQTATTARQQSYVFRYSSTALTASSTNSNALLDNTDNLKVGDKVLDSSGNIYVVTAIDTANSTFTIGTSLIDLAQDSDVVHKSGNETISGNKTFSSINGVEPSALGMPDLDNGIDISSYITHLDKVVNKYTPPANGWLSIRIKKTSLVHASLMIYQTGGLLSSCETDEFNISGTNLPVIANQNVEIYIYADALASAKFYPCQGNV